MKNKLGLATEVPHKRTRINPVHAWRSLTPHDQERIGVAAVSLGLSLLADGQQTGEDVGVEAAHCETEALFMELMEQAFPQQEHGGTFALPDLQTIGIRVCETLWMHGSMRLPGWLLVDRHEPLLELL